MGNSMYAIGGRSKPHVRTMGEGASMGGKHGYDGTWPHTTAIARPAWQVGLRWGEWTLLCALEGAALF